ncbi:hypothetical protein UFOVP458_45 [uncultured Caudovirales phage]|uniref:Uncharacterized protein n=1 Tax=uncultured Caudovirales phage TaxID=2100421 RepID=A0A6J5MHG6_9CAUD|nr:hypothetical protein UFOVP458_45 [uncultured Caudovirales phage]
MEEIKAPKKERKFLKAVGNIAKVLANELVMGIARKFIGKAIDKVGNKRQGLLIVLIILASSFAIAQYPTTGNKQRLGFQTTGDGLTWRGSISDTAFIQPINNQSAWVILDTINLKFYTFDFTSNAWNLVGGASGLTMPFDSITFNTAKDGTVGVGEVEYNDTQGSLIQGLKGGLVTNVIGQQLHQRVNNRTGASLAKGTVVYLAGSQGNRITVAKALGVTDAFSANTFGIVAEDILNNQSGYVITEGLITGLNTSALVEDSAVYLSPTVAGALTSTKPQAPQHTVYIGVCVKSNAGSGELFVKIRNGQELDELHDVRITSPVNKASLYYFGGLWRDTTAALLVSDTASMLANYATKAYADTTGRLYARQDYTTGVTSSTLTWTQTDTLIPGGVNVIQVYRNGQILLPSQYTIPTSTSVIIAASSFKVNDNYTVIFPRGGGAGSGGGSGSLTSISAGTGITVSPNPITTTGVVSADLSVLMELTDTSLLNLTTRFASKLNTTDTASLSNRINAKGNGTVTSVATGYGLTGGTITTTGTLRVDSNTVYNYVRDSIVKVRIGNDTIKILKQEYDNVTSDTLVWTTTVKFPIQLRAYILLFRNGQLLINDQFSIIDTNKIKVAASSYKLGENYTLVTVSGIGSAGVSQTGNPIYPEAGIAVSTGTTWTTSIPNNSTNWNTAFTDRLKWDGGSTGLVPSTGRTSLGGTTIGQSMFTLTNPSTISFPRFNGDNTITARSAANFRSDIGAGSVTTVTVAAGTPLSIQNNTTTPEISMAAASGSVNGYLLSTDWTTFNGKQNALSNASASVSGILTSTDWTIFNNKQNALTNPVTGTGTNNYIPKFTTTGSTIGNSTLIDNGTTISTASILSTTNYAALDAGNNTHRLTNTLSGNQTWTPSAGFLTSYFNNNVSGGWYYNTLVDNSGFPILSILSTSNDRKKSGITLNSQETANGTYSPAITFSSLSNSTSYYSAYAAIIGKKTGVGGPTGSDGNWNTGHIEFYGTTQATDVNGGVMLNSPSMTLGVGVGIGYNAPPTIKGRLTVLEKLGINQPTPAFALDVSGTANITGATTLGSTLAVTNAVTLSTTTATPASLLGKSTGNVVGNVRLTSPFILTGDSLNLGTVPISKGGTGATSASAARTSLDVDYLFIEVSAGSSVSITRNRISLVNTGTFTTTSIDLTPATNGRIYMIKNLAVGSVVSSASNVIPFAGGSPGTAILSAGNVTPQWVTLVADGTNWHIMQKN